MKTLNNIIEKSYILTKDGYQYIDDIIGNNIIWDGYKWKEVNISKNNEILNEYIYYKLIYSDGCEIICDKSQKLYIVDNMRSNIYRNIPISVIKENALIYKYSFPLIDGDIKNDLKYPYILGYIVEYIHNIDKNNISNEQIKNLLHTIPNKNINFRLLLNIIDNYKNNLTIPINATYNNRLLWISGLIDKNGSITKIKDGIYLNIVVNSKELAMNIKYIFNTLGTNPRITENEEIRRIMKTELTQKTEEISRVRYKLIFNADDTNKIFLDYDIKTYIFIYDKTQYSLDQDINRYLSIKKIIKITDIKKTYSIQNTYSIISNGILI